MAKSIPDNLFEVIMWYEDRDQERPNWWPKHFGSLS